NGIYRSDDMGLTWRNMGLEKTGRIGRIVIDPRDPDIVFAAAMGHCYGPQKERGVFRTLDGGKTWQQVLFVDDNTGCSDLAMDPVNPQTIFAGMWHMEIKTWGMRSGGTGGGVYVSRDGGTTWKKLIGHGLPAADKIVGKTAVAIAHSDPRRVYVLQEDTTAMLYRSDDGGENWRVVNRSHKMSERMSYYTRFAVSPDDPDRLYFASVSWSVSNDGGLTLDLSETSAGGDNHDIWIDPGNPNWVMVAHDQGASISFDKGRKYHYVALPIAQMYHVWVDNDVPYHVYGNRQDGGSYRGPGISLTGRIPLSSWQEVGGCECGFAIPDPTDSNIIWSGCYDGQLDRTDLSTGQVRSVHVWPEATYGYAPADVKHRWHWTFPVAISPHDHNTVYVGSQYVNMTTDAGQSFKIISPDLTTNDKTHQKDSGILTIDNLMTFDGCVLFAISESPKEKGLIWTGSNDGQVHLTRDGGANWTNLTANIKGLPPWGTIENIEPSRYDGGTAYISVDLHQMGNFDPYIYKTADYGKTWTIIVGGIPKSVSSFVHVVREDPKRKGMLYAGTDNAVYMSKDDGATWQPIQFNLPPAPVYWLTVQENFDDLAIATYGRGFWILDDLGFLRDMTPEAAAADVHLFKPRDAYRFHSWAGFRDPGSSYTIGTFVDGENVPYGASINFQLKAPIDRVEIQITNQDGQPVRTLSVPGRAGMNRVWWNLRYDSAPPVVLRTPPPNAPWVTLGPDGTRPLVFWLGPSSNPLAVPGTYTVTLKASGKTIKQPLTILADPGYDATMEGMQEQLAFALQLREDITAVGAAINDLEWTRRQLIEYGAMITSDPQVAAKRQALLE
ncbi:MAG: glycosyl hydrolase, partial [Candidatus Omnitrophica bacterium]|nr:glycosyl hydrolase [Candidatus Omnitrophota bacterium]